VTRVLHQEPGTLFVTGGFESPAMASPEARSDQSRGSAHVHGVDVRVKDGPAMASPEARSDQVRGSVQDRGVGDGMMLSPQRESGSQKADLGALGGGAHGLQALAQSVIAGKAVYLQGVKISPAQVASFVDHKRSRVFLNWMRISVLWIIRGRSTGCGYRCECYGDHRVEASPFQDPSVETGTMASKIGTWSIS